MIDVNFKQASKALSPILFTELGMVMEDKLVNANASRSILVTEFGMVMEVNREQPLKARDPIYVTVLGIMMEVSWSQFVKPAIPVTFLV